MKTVDNNFLINQTNSTIKKHDLELSETEKELSRQYRKLLEAIKEYNSIDDEDRYSLEKSDFANRLSNFQKIEYISKIELMFELLDRLKTYNNKKNLNDISEAEMYQLNLWEDTVTAWPVRYDNVFDLIAHIKVVADRLYDKYIKNNDDLSRKMKKLAMALLCLEDLNKGEYFIGSADYEKIVSSFADSKEKVAQLTNEYLKTTGFSSKEMLLGLLDNLQRKINLIPSEESSFSIKDQRKIAGSYIDYALLKKYTEETGLMDIFSKK